MASATTRPTTSKKENTSKIENKKYGVIVKIVDDNLLEFNLTKNFPEKIDFQNQIVALIDAFFVLLSKNSDTTFNIVGKENYGTSTNIIDTKTRDKIVSLFEHPQINKVGLYGGNIISKNLSNMLAIIAAKNRQFKYFDNKESALKWLAS